MPGNTLVIRIYQKLSEKSYQDIYIFFDHDIESYGIRGCRYINNSTINKYSSFLSNDTSLNNFLKFVLNYENMYNSLSIENNNSKFLSLSLFNYPNLSLYSHNITYDELNYYNINIINNCKEKNEILPHEIMGYEYINKEQMNEFQSDIFNLFDILKNAWD